MMWVLTGNCILCKGQLSVLSCQMRTCQRFWGVKRAPIYIRVGICLSRRIPMGLSPSALGRCRDIKGPLFSERNANASTKSLIPRSQSPPFQPWERGQISIFAGCKITFPRKRKNLTRRFYVTLHMKYGYLRLKVSLFQVISPPNDTELFLVLVIFSSGPRSFRRWRFSQC